MKIAIVNDMPLALETLRRVVVSDERHQVIWMAEDGKAAVENCARQAPDLILMDLIMPVMDGVEATRRIMRLSPCPILVVTATVTGNSAMVFEAMGAGALDAVATPVLGGEVGRGEELLRKIERIGKITGALSSSPAACATKKKVTGAHARETGPCLLVIGSSTGGPQALLEILRNFPVEFSASIVLVQHMDEQFTGGLADWFAAQLRLPVRVLREGDRPRPGQVLIPSTNNHAVMRKGGTLGYSPHPKNNYYHPSVDVFFHSVARYWPGKCIGVILTGMGRDGAEGLLALRRAGHFTIAQDRESSVVFGMPGAAIELGAPAEVLPAGDIGPRINMYLAGKKQEKK